MFLYVSRLDEFYVRKKWNQRWSQVISGFWEADSEMEICIHEACCVYSQDGYLKEEKIAGLGREEN